MLAASNAARCTPGFIGAALGVGLERQHLQLILHAPNGSPQQQQHTGAESREQVWELILHTINFPASLCSSSALGSQVGAA